MNNDTLYEMILRHGARLEKIENDLRYIEKQLLKLNLATQHVQNENNQIYEKIGRCC